MNKPFEIVYQRRGGSFNQVATNKATEAQAKAFCRKLSNFPEDTIHYAICHEDGRTIHDTRKDGLL